MKKLFLVLVAILFMASSAYAFSWTENGVVNIDTVYVVGMANLVSGDVVILQTTSPTYWGREVTGTTTQGLPIFGVVLGDPDFATCDDGGWIRVQTYGYCPIVKIADKAAVTENSSYLVTSTQLFRANSHQELNGADSSTGRVNAVTGNSVSLQTQKGNGGAGLPIIKAFLDR